MARKLKPQPQLINPVARLLAPLDEPYTDELVTARGLDLAEIYAEAEADRDKAWRLVELSRQSFWAHLALFVWTHDEKAISIRLKPFSPLRMYQVIADFMDEKLPDGRWAHPLIAADKSRQLMMSWLCVARLDWCCIHRQKSYCFVISEDLNKAADQVERVRTIHEHYPEWFRMALGEMRARPRKGGFVYQNGSRIDSVQQKSGRGVASYVPTMGLNDECCHQQYFEKNWTAIKGTAGNLSQILNISSAAPSDFQDLMIDRVDGRRGGREKTYFEMTGISAWRNRLNRIDCMRIHYTADPGRRTLEWKMQAIQGMQAHQWRQEQEIDYSARGGRPIFTMLDRTIHVTRGHVRVWCTGPRRYMMQVSGWDSPRPVKALLRAIDHGTSGYCAAVWVAVDEDLDWFVYRVYKKTGWIASMNAAAIAELSLNKETGVYEEYAFDLIDAMQGMPDAEGKVEDVYRDYVDPRGNKPLRRLEAVEKGSGSRQEGLDLIASMLMSGQAVNNANGEFWRETVEEYREIMREPTLSGGALRNSFAQFSSLYLARDQAEPLFAELDAARWDEPTNKDPDAQRPETSTDMMDDCIDCLRYLIRRGRAKFLRQNLNINIG